MALAKMEYHDFDTADTLAHRMADHVAAALSVAIAERGLAVLALSAGAIPESFFLYLAQANIAWENIIITLVDERCLPLDHVRSHEGLVRHCLIQNHAGKARFIGLYSPAGTAELSAFSAANRISNLPRPFDVVVLDLGAGGQIASLLPLGNRLKQALDSNCRALVVPMYAKESEDARLTMTLPLLTSARFVALHISGESKRRWLEQIQGDEMHSAFLPVGAFLESVQNTVRVFYAPEVIRPVEEEMVAKVVIEGEALAEQDEPAEPLA